jgi:hypothetical protein
MFWGGELLKPANIISITIGVIGIVAGAIIALYFYNKSERIGRISVAIEQVQVFDKARIGQLPLRVLDSSGNTIKDNVFAANVTIWNPGTGEIIRDDVRKPFFLKIGTGLLPLDITMTRTSHENVDDLVVRPDGEIDWKHFDPGEGIKIRLVYVSDSILDIHLDGSALGLERINYDSGLLPKYAIKDHILHGIITLILGGFAIFGFFNQRRDKFTITLGIVSLVVFFFASGRLILDIFPTLTQNVPPV